MTGETVSRELNAFVEMSPGAGPPEVSILMPVCEQHAFVSEALHSILAQRGVVAEIVVSDDASRDGTYAVARDCILAWLKRHPVRHRILLRQGSERLRRDHLALLLDHASGDTVMQAHGDDVSHPDRARILLQVFRQQAGATMITSLANDVRPDDNATTTEFAAASSFQVTRYSMEEILHGSMALTGFAQAWSRGAQAGFTRLDSTLAAVSHDRITAFRAGLAGRVLLVHAPLVNRRHHPANWSSNMGLGNDEATFEFGWSFVRISALEVMAGDVLRAGETGLIDRESCERLARRVAAVQGEHKEAMLRAYRSLTREGFVMSWRKENG